LGEEHQQRRENLLRSRRTLTEQKEYIDILKYCSEHMMGLVRFNM
jgi:hypothetical protein